MRVITGVPKDGQAVEPVANRVRPSTDTTEGVVVGVRVTNEGADYEELTESASKVEENTGKLPEQMVVDGGCISRENIIKIKEKGVDLIGSFQEKKKR